MTGRTHLALWVIAVFFTACKAEAPPKADVPKPAPPKAAPTEDKPAVEPTPAPASVRADSRAETKQKETEKLLLDGNIVAVSLLSPRSLSLKVRLEGGGRAVFKPLRKGDRRAPFETAAYRMARLLQIEAVPVSVLRKIPAAFLIARLEKDDPKIAAAFRDAVPADESGKVEGAVIEWMEDIDKEALSQLGGIPAINRMLAPGRPANGDEPLAVAASNMVVFDHIIGNWDRFSGGNFFVSKDGVHLILIDHNGSFAPWPKMREEKMAARLRATERFSASLLERIRNLTRASVQAAAADVGEGAPLLSDEQIDLLLARRDEVVRHVEGLVEKNGLASTVVFP